MIIEKANPNLKLTRPAVIIDIELEPKPKAPLPFKNGFAIAIVGAPGSGKSSVLFSLIKSKDAYRKRFHKVIAVIPSSSLDSLKSNPLKDLPEEQHFDELSYDNLEEIIDMVEENRDDELLTLLLLDDVSAELQDPIILKKMMRLYLNRRHLKLSIISIAHSLTGKGALPYTIRKNLSHLILFKPSSSLDILNHDFLHMPKDKFKELTDYVYKDPHDHLMIELNRNKLYKNFNALTLR
jgi:AAA15 family ATPase/GTPase